MPAIFKKIKLKYLLLCLILIISAGLVWLFINIFYCPISSERLDPTERYMVRQINKKWGKLIEKMSENEKKIADYNLLMNDLNFLEKKFSSRIFSIDPASLGFKGPFFTRQLAENLIEIPSVELNTKDGPVKTGINFLPRPIYEDYERMRTAIKQELGKDLYIESSYRSPGYQATLFFHYLSEENGYSLKENAKWIAMPGYSEHGSLNTALDFINQEGISGEGKNQTAEDFEKLPEYQWLQTNAAEYNFYLSYPRDNNWGVSFEPWHWHWEKK